MLTMSTHHYFKNNFPLIETLLECGAKGSVGKDKDGSQVLHFQAGKADELDLSNFYPDARVVSEFLYRICSLVQMQHVSR